jgi:hypothetical protein
MTLSAAAKAQRQMQGAALAQAVTLNALRGFKAGVRGLKPAGLHIGTEFKDLIQQGYSRSGGGGSFYTHHKTKQKVMSSAPGTPPALQTGVLRDSVNFRVSKVPSRGAGGKFQRSGAVNISIWAEAEYAASHEFAANVKNRRPNWRPVAETFASQGRITLLTSRYFTLHRNKGIAMMAPTIEVNTLNRRAAALGASMGI